jgi:hypothetical protein
MTFTLSRTSNKKHAGLGVIPVEICSSELQRFEAMSNNLPAVSSMLENPVGPYQTELAKLWGRLFFFLEHNGYPTELDRTYRIKGVDLALEYYLLYQARAQESAKALFLHYAILQLRMIGAAYAKKRYNTALRLYPKFTTAMMSVVSSSMEDKYIAGNNRTGEAARASKSKKEENVRIAIEIAQQLLAAHPRWKKVDVYKPVAEKLNLAPSTIKGYLNGISLNQCDPGS